MTGIENPEKWLLAVGLPDRVEESVCIVATYSSIKKYLAEFGSSRNSKNKHRSIRERKEPDSDPSDSQQSDEPRKTQSVAISENGIGTSRISEDISEEVK